MNERIRKYIDQLFADAPKTRKALELKEEMTRNTMEKYADLVSDGYAEEDAFRNVVNGIGDVQELFADLEEKNLLTLSETDRKKKAMFNSVAVGLYILAGVVFFGCVLLDGTFVMRADLTMIGLVLAGFICIVPTCMLVYAANMYPAYHRKEESLVENYKENRYLHNKDKAVKISVSVIIWSLVLVLYFIISFLFGAWYITWVIFLVGACVQAIVALVFSLRKKEV